MKQLILHIPHSSTLIPSYEGYCLDGERLEQELLKLTDWHTDDLFESSDDVTIRAEFSRIFCDVERFSDDEQEVMAKLGMGVLYTKTDTGEDMRRVTDEMRSQCLAQYYWPHHQRLSKAVNESLMQSDKALIVDCHSYSDVPFMRDLDQNPVRPDFNIGTDKFHTPENLVFISVQFFKDQGYSLGVDYPYSGSLVPMEHYQKNQKVESIMLEVNRKLYLDEGANTKSANYPKIKKVVQEYLSTIKG